jgi:hypothetical protein
MTDALGPRPPLLRDRSNVKAQLEYDRRLGIHYAIPFSARMRRPKPEPVKEPTNGLPD